MDTIAGFRLPLLWLNTVPLALTHIYACTCMHTFYAQPSYQHLWLWFPRATPLRPCGPSSHVETPPPQPGPPLLPQAPLPALLVLGRSFPTLPLLPLLSLPSCGL